MPDGITTEAAAEALGTTKRKLVNLTKKYPHLVPAGRFGDLWVWTEADIQAVRTLQENVARQLCAKCGGSLTEPTG